MVTNRDPNDLLSRLVTMDETWLYHYGPGTKQQSMEWRHSGLSRPKNSKCKNPLEKFSPRFLGSRRHPLHWLSSKGPNYQRGVLLISAGAFEGHFEGKTQWEFHQGFLVHAPKFLASLGTCNPEETDPSGPPVSWSPTYPPDVAPSDYHLFLGLKEKIGSSPFFVRRGICSCRGDLVGRTTFWINFLSGLQKLQQRTKKCIELRGEYDVE